MCIRVNSSRHGFSISTDITGRTGCCVVNPLILCRSCGRKLLAFAVGWWRDNHSNLIAARLVWASVTWWTLSIHPSRLGARLWNDGECASSLWLLRTRNHRLVHPNSGSIDGNSSIIVAGTCVHYYVYEYKSSRSVVGDSGWTLGWMMARRIPSGTPPSFPTNCGSIEILDLRA